MQASVLGVVTDPEKDRPGVISLPSRRHEPEETARDLCLRRHLDGGWIFSVYVDPKRASGRRSKHRRVRDR